MKCIILFFLIIFCCLIQCFSNKTEINLLTYTFDSSTNINNTEFEQLFSDYAEKKNLNIKLNIEVIEFENPSDSYTNFKSLVELSLKKSNDRTSGNNQKFDLYTYSNRYTNIYAPYLLDLKKNLPNEYIEMFNPKIVKESCIYKNKKDEEEVVGLPMTLSYEVLYSNTKLLEKYNKPIPKTWDELIDTCEYIMEKEKNNTTDLICYNGLFDDTEQGFYSLYEFIYSCRNSYNSTYPNPKDPLFSNSLNFLKNLKNKVATDDIFKSDEKFIFTKIFDAKFIFVKYWLVGEPLLSILRMNYSLSNLPGIKEGISGTSILGNNIGIVKNITDDKKEASLEVLKYYISKEAQRESFSKRFGATAIDELLNEEELCFDEICDIIKNVQFTVEPEFIKEGRVDYRKRYRKYIYQFLFNEKITLDETLKKINDITKIYWVSLGTKDSYVGLIFFILSSVISVLMLLSLILLFRDNFHPFFMFLSDDFWIVTVLGSILLLWIPYINFGKVETMKCHLRSLYMIIGYTLSLCPTFYKLIAQFPEENKIIKLVINHRYLFLLFNLIIDISLCSISLLNPYSAQYVLVEDGESFEKCKFNGNYSIIVLFVYKILVIFLMLFLIFVEWNISTSVYDMKPILMVLYIDILFIVLIYVFHIINIKNYIGYFILQLISTFAISVSNYLFLYGIRVFLGFIKKQNIKAQFINNINEKFINEENLSQIKNSLNNNEFCDSKVNDDDSKNYTLTSESYHKKFLKRMIDYHYTIYTNTNSATSTNITSNTTSTTNSFN